MNHARPLEPAAAQQVERVVVPRRSTGEHVADSLRAMILAGELSPGSPLREVAVAERFDVSRRTVRDALGILTREGIVRHSPHKRTEITRFSAEDVRDLYRVRRTLESAGAASVSATATPAMHHLETILGQLEDASRRGDPAEIVEQDLLFHRGVVHLLGSPRVNRFFDDIASELRFALSILESAQHESVLRPVQAFEEHREIFQALHRLDADAATALIVAHADANETLLLEIVASV